MEKFFKFSSDFMGPKAQSRGGYSPTSMLIYPRRPFLGRSRGGGWGGLGGSEWRETGGWWSEQDVERGSDKVEMENDNLIWFDLWRRMDSQCPFSGGAVTEGKRQEEERRGRRTDMGGACGRTASGGWGWRGARSSFCSRATRRPDSCCWRH